MPPDTDGLAIGELYDPPRLLQPSPAAALPLVQALLAQPALAQYHWLSSASADLTRNARERLLARAHHNQPEGGPS